MLALVALLTAAATVGCWGLAVYFRWIRVESGNFDVEGAGVFFLILSVAPGLVALATWMGLRDLRRAPVRSIRRPGLSMPWLFAVCVRACANLPSVRSS
mgnify:CR=1 FL=1